MRRLSYEDLLEFWDLHRAPRNRLIWCRTQMQNMKALLTRSHRTRIVVHHFWVQRIALLVVQNEPGEWERGATFTAHNWSLPNRGFCVRIFLRLTAFPESVHYVHLIRIQNAEDRMWEGCVELVASGTFQWQLTKNSFKKLTKTKQKPETLQHGFMSEHDVTSFQR